MDFYFQIGYLNEKGSPAKRIPPTPFLTVGVKKAEKKCAEILKKYGNLAFGNPKELKNGLNAAGLVAQNSVKKIIRTQEGFKPLSKRTLAERKAAGFKGEKRLVRTGQLINSITYVIRDKNAKN